MKLDQNELVMLKLCILKIIFPILISSMTLGSDLKTYFRTFETHIKNIYSQVRVKCYLPD